MRSFFLRTEEGDWFRWNIIKKKCLRNFSRKRRAMKCCHGYRCLIDQILTRRKSRDFSTRTRTCYSDCRAKMDGEKTMDKILPDKNVTEEEFQNFMHRVTEVEKIVKKLASDDAEEQERGMLMADKVLDGKTKGEITEMGEIRIKCERTVINKLPESQENADPSRMSRDAFMQSMEKDAKERAEDRKRRNERAETYKRIANGAFGLGDYEKAVTYYGKAVEQRKDSAVLWNNRALSYMRLGLYESALRDLEWALKVNNSNIKALLNSAKCHARLANETKRDEFITLARELNPHLTNYINDFERELMTESDEETTRAEDSSVD